MALTEDTIVDSIDVLPDGQIQVRKANRVFRDGVEISKAYHRHVVSPGDDLALEDSRVADDLTTDTPEELKEKWPEGLPKE